MKNCSPECYCSNMGNMRIWNKFIDPRCPNISTENNGRFCAVKHLWQYYILDVGINVTRPHGPDPDYPEETL